MHNLFYSFSVETSSIAASKAANDETVSFESEAVEPSKDVAEVENTSNSSRVSSEIQTMVNFQVKFSNDFDI